MKCRLERHIRDEMRQVGDALDTRRCRRCRAI